MLVALTSLSLTEDSAFHFIVFFQLVPIDIREHNKEGNILYLNVMCADRGESFARIVYVHVISYFLSADI